MAHNYKDIPSLQPFFEPCYTPDNKITGHFFYPRGKYFYGKTIPRNPTYYIHKYGFHYDGYLLGTCQMSQVIHFFPSTCRCIQHVQTTNTNSKVNGQSGYRENSDFEDIRRFYTLNKNVSGSQNNIPNQFDYYGHSSNDTRQIQEPARNQFQNIQGTIKKQVDNHKPARNPTDGMFRAESFDNDGGENNLVPYDIKKDCQEEPMDYENIVENQNGSFNLQDNSLIKLNKNTSSQLNPNALEFNQSFEKQKSTNCKGEYHFPQNLPPVHDETKFIDPLQKIDSLQHSTYFKTHDNTTMINDYQEGTKNITAITINVRERPLSDEIHGPQSKDDEGKIGIDKNREELKCNFGDNQVTNKTTERNEHSKKINFAINKIEELNNEATLLVTQVDIFEGTKDDQKYIYLEEMLTRILLKLDNVETENDLAIRTKRKESIVFTKGGLRNLRAKVNSDLEAKYENNDDKNGKTNKYGNEPFDQDDRSENAGPSLPKKSERNELIPIEENEENKIY